MQSLKEIGDECVESIRLKMNEYNINATGRTSNALFVDAESVTFNGADIPIRLRVGLRGNKFAPAESLEIGRSAEECASQVDLLASILEWVKAKGLETDDKKAKRAAGAISASISREGTERYRIPNTDVTTPAVSVAIDKVKALVKGALVKSAMLHK